MRSFLLALQLLTRVPVSVRGEVTPGELARSAALFPLVGALQGLFAAAGAALFLRAFPPGIAGALVVTLLVLSNGGFHLDGLADTFDGLAVRSTGDAAHDRERRLAVMKDSATGAIGTVAVVLVVLLQALFLGALLSVRPPGPTLGLVFLMPILSKWAFLPALLAGVPARADGLGRAFIERCTPGILLTGTVIALALGTAGLLAAGVRGTVVAAAAAAGVLCGLAPFVLLFTRYCRTAFGGITGDSLGAIGELAEILFLAGATAWMRHSI